MIIVGAVALALVFVIQWILYKDDKDLVQRIRDLEAVEEKHWQEAVDVSVDQRDQVVREYGALATRLEALESRADDDAAAQGTPIVDEEVLGRPTGTYADTRGAYVDTPGQRALKF